MEIDFGSLCGALVAGEEHVVVFDDSGERYDASKECEVGRSRVWVNLAWGFPVRRDGALVAGEVGYRVTCGGCERAKGYDETVRVTGDEAARMVEKVIQGFGNR